MMDGSTYREGYAVAQQPVLVVMGVSGSGKSTVAATLTTNLGWDFQEGDDLHPPANVAKMAAGHPLTDSDRRPWLETVADWIRTHTDAGRPGIITCSALKRSYRDILRGEHVVFVYLAVPAALLAERVAHRTHEFMTASLLESQLATLEPPAVDERAVEIAVTGTPAQAAADVIGRLRLERI